MSGPNSKPELQCDLTLGPSAPDVHLDMGKRNVIRISQRQANRFDIILINKATDNKIYNQGNATGAETPEAAYQWAHQCLPASLIEGRAWEYRSEDGVYADLDPIKLGWVRA